MATVAQQVILHPAVSQSLKVWSTTLGRDKTYRAVQYFARFLAWLLLSRGYKIEAARWNALKSHLGLGRKLMRLGKPMEHLQAALRATQSAAPHPAEQITTIGRQLGYFGYLTYDALVWANSVKFFNVKPSTAATIGKRANQFWLTGILCSIAFGLLKSSRLKDEAKAWQGTEPWTEKGVEVDRDAKLQANLAAVASTRQQFVIDLLDIWIPASNLGFVNLPDGIVGIFGCVFHIRVDLMKWLNVNGKK